MPRDWPHTPAQQERIVREAIRFIQRVQDETEFGFAMEVGGYLFRTLFKSDLNLLRSTNRWKSRALRSISADERAGLTYEQLQACLKTYVLASFFPRRGRPEPPHLSRWVWKLMWELVDDPETLFLLVEWIERRNVPKHLVRTVVQTVHPYIAAGGHLMDLLVDPEAIRGEDSPYKRIKRMLTIEMDWVTNGPPIPEDTRQVLITLLHDIESLLRTPSSA